MSGKLNYSKAIKRLLRRYNFTIFFLIGGFVLPSIILVAIIDFVSTAKSKDAQMHKAALRSELSQFVLALREDESASLAKFPTVYGSSQRFLQAVPIAQPFFTYFLNRGNAKYFDSSRLNWEAPASCSIEFSPTKSSGVKDENPTRACLGFVPNDAAGNYLYFSLRYRAEEVTRHEQGTAFSTADHVGFDLHSKHRKVRLQLVYEPSTLAVERYPSQLQRFFGLHEITAYLGDDPRHPTRAVSGQAFEQSYQDNTGKLKKFVTLLVRIDPSLVLDSSDAANQSFNTLQSVRAAVAVYLKDATKKKSVPILDIPFNMQGTAVMSLEKLYLANVPSKAKLILSRTNDERIEQIWSSDSIADEVKHPSGFQTASDKWAEWIVSKFGYKSLEANASQQLGKDSPLQANLKQDGVLLPDVATRSFLYLSLALLFILGALFYLSVSLLHLRRIFLTSYRITVNPRENIPLFKHERGSNEISRLGRIVYLLISQNRSRTLRLQKKIRQEQNEQIERSRIEQEHVRNRKAILDAIGHEIKSPLQSLLAKIPRESDANRDVERMKRAVEALDFATSVETGLQASMMVNKFLDIAVYISTFTRNTASQGIVYDGPSSDVIAYFDPIALDTVFDHILSNAFRLRNQGSDIAISLKKSISTVQIEIYNEGPCIESGKEDAIFMLGVSSKDESGNLGQGLFAARAQMVGMRGSITAENRTNGVVFILHLSLKQG
jgi:signal transduction histidine kinase